MKVVQVGGVFMLAVAVAIHDEKHIHTDAYGGEPQATRPLGDEVSTATATAIPMFSEWGSLDNIPL